jgi:hypothetical protein
VCAPSSSASFYARRATRNAAARSSDSASAAALDEPAAATNETALEVALRPGGGLAVNVKGDVAALLTAVSGLKEVAGGGVMGGGSATVLNAAAALSGGAADAASLSGAASPQAVMVARGIVWEGGLGLYDATHVIYNGELQPLYFDIAPPFIVVAEGDPLTTRRVDVTPAMLCTLPVLRLPANEKEVAALLAGGAVPGVKVARVERDDNDERSYNYSEGRRKFPAMLNGARKYFVHDGCLRPVYYDSRHKRYGNMAPAHVMWGCDKFRRAALDAPGLAIYLEVEAPPAGEDGK